MAQHREVINALFRLVLGLVVLNIGLVAVANAQGTSPLREMKTAGGTRFVLIGEPGARPGPVVFLLGLSLKETLADPQFALIQAPLRKIGTIFVTLDSPGHGAEKPEDESNPLRTWRVRIERGENPFEPFVKSLSGILNYLVGLGYANPELVAAAGISRGGYLALRFAIEEPRVRAVAAFAPVIDLLFLREFSGMGSSALAQSLSLINGAESLAGRRVLIMIGSTDNRVGTENSVEFFKRLVDRAVAKRIQPEAELHVTSSRGHHLEPHDYSAGGEWLVRALVPHRR